MSPNFDRVLLIRHLAICAGAVAAYLLRSELQIGVTALWIVGVGALLNFSAYVFRTRRSLARLCALASPVIGVGSWAALVAVTNGVTSPFVAGLWLEVVLSAMHLARVGIAVVTLAAVAALWSQQAWVGLEGAQTPLLLQSGFLLGMGGATLLVYRRWQRTQRRLAEREEELSRLRELERELDDERSLASLGEGVARLAHGLKNAVHSLRGFVSLIEPKLQGRSAEGAFAGLRAAIDDLEALARMTLDTDSGESAQRPRATRPSSVVRRALREIELAHPQVHWKTSSDGADPLLPIAESDLLEVLSILLTNAVEAMGGIGDGAIESRRIGSELCLLVRDAGPGFSEEDLPRVFQPGFTTKPDGSGYGLFLARKIVKQHGGRLAARARSPRGGVVEMALPLEPPGGPDRATTGDAEIAP